MDKCHGGGGGGAHKIGPDTWRLWSRKLSDAVGHEIELFPGSFNVRFDDPERVDKLTKGSLCQRRHVLKCTPLPGDEPDWRRRKRRDGKPYLFYEVRLEHDGLWRVAFLWLPIYELRERNRQGATHKGRYDFVLSYVANATAGRDRVNVDFEPTFGGSGG